MAMSALAPATGVAPGPWGVGATVFAVLAACAHLAEPLQLKRSGVAGPALLVVL